jgi:hypothetical protein
MKDSIRRVAGQGEMRGSLKLDGKGVREEEEGKKVDREKMGGRGGGVGGNFRGLSWVIFGNFQNFISGACVFPPLSRLPRGGRPVRKYHPEIVQKTSSIFGKCL